MAGRGPAPKDPSQRLRRNQPPAPQRVYECEPVTQPDLPPLYLPDAEGKLVRRRWPAQTKRWWETWGREPMAADFRPTDWDFLIDTALLHAAYWQGAVSLAPEIRLRVAKLGATAEDRARLRITYANADEAEAKRSKPERSSARERRGPLRVVG